MYDLFFEVEDMNMPETRGQHIELHNIRFMNMLTYLAGWEPAEFICHVEDLRILDLTSFSRIYGDLGDLWDYHDIVSCCCCWRLHVAHEPFSCWSSSINTNLCARMETRKPRSHRGCMMTMVVYACVILLLGWPRIYCRSSRESFRCG